MKNIDLTAKTVIVTGGSTGIGLETVKTLAGAGASVIVPARDLRKAARNLEGIANTELREMDLMQPASIDAFAEEFLSSDRSLHILINNAGIMWVPLRFDSRGIESQLATNYVAQFHLTARLWPALKQAGGARVVNVSSQGHQFNNFDFDDPDFSRRSYETLLAYGQSKTASNLFALELDKRAKEFGVRAYSLHPGSIAGTELGREASLETFQKLGLVDGKGNLLPEVAASLKNIPQGAATTVWCATSPLLNEIGGVYCEDVEVAQVSTDPGASNGVRAYSLDGKNAERLWNWTEKIAGVSFKL
ncbi:MAG TPA: SDR family NAD(P)-dependent oxidoreductase [Dyadobacter sp.]|nr:SDR family NAD(P)-dependent oxidoreductase [Dyadobacter sp.]